MARVESYNLGRIGFIGDISGHDLPPEAWTAARNVRFENNKIVKFLGHERVLGTPGTAPGFILNIPQVAESIWIYTSLNKMYAITSGVHDNITRQAMAADVDYTTTAYEQWQGGVLGGIPILNNGVDTPQMWPSLSPGSPAEDLLNWPEAVLAKIVRPYGPFLIALNIIDGSHYPHMIWWSHPADPGDVPASWSYTDPTKLAGRAELTDVDGGAILDGLMLRDLFMIYKENSTHMLRFVGGQGVMKTEMLFAGSGILAPRCVCVVQKGAKHFVATGDDIIVHNGQSFESVLDTRAASYFANDMALSAKETAFAMHNPSKREAWLCYPEVGSLVPTKALVWNYKDNTVTFRDFDGRFATPGFVADIDPGTWDPDTNPWDSDSSLWGAEAKKQTVYCSPTAEKFYQLDKGETFDGVPVAASIERVGLAVIGKDRNGQPKVSIRVNKLVKRLWPKVTGTQELTIRIGMQERIDGAIVWSDPVSFNPVMEDFVDIVISGKLIAVRIEATGSTAWTLEGYDLDMELLGEY